jgi:hypothetical protein
VSRTPAVAGNRTTWTWAGWVKRSGLGTDQVLFDCRPVVSDSQFSVFYLNSTNALSFSGPITTWFTTSAVFRDCSAWVHIVLALDTTQATAADRIKLYVNGSQVTAFSTSVTPSSFTEVSATTGQLIPLAYSGSYGTNGFQLKFSDNSAATAATLVLIPVATGITGRRITSALLLVLATTAS